MRIYIPVKYKLVLTMAFAMAWISFSLWIGWPWIEDLSERFSRPVAWSIFAGLALIPGWANAFLLGGLLFDRRPNYRIHREMPPVSILIAAFNEEGSIGETLDSILAQSYEGEVEIIVIDDGSSDGTAQRVRAAMARSAATPNFWIRLLALERNAGKANALNAGLAEATHPLIITLDADTFMFRDSLARLVANLIDGPANTAAVAGTVLVRNSRTNFLTRLQEWDYFLGIAVVKRIQSLFQGTLVAQGAFSIYRREAIDRVGGWTQTVGEDIVLTWAFHALGYRVAYAENAFVFTNVPEGYGQFFRQRQRWARGLIEAIKKYPEIFARWRMVTPFLYLNLLFPYLDFIYLFVFVPGIIAALFFRDYAIVGLMTLFLLPLTLLMNLIMFRHQRRIFRRHGLKVRKNVLGLTFYMLTYQMLMTPASLAGYLSEFLNLKKKWGTKAAPATLLAFCLLLSPLFAPVPADASAPHRLFGEYEFSVDSDSEEHHGFYLGYRQKLRSLRAGEIGVRAGTLEVRDPSGRERFDSLRLTYDGEIRDTLRLIAAGTVLNGDDWNPLLGSASAVYTPSSRWRLELFAERGIVDSVEGIRQELSIGTYGGSVDYRLGEEVTLVAALFQQRISDGNDRTGSVARAIYAPKRFEGFHLQLYGKRLTSEFDGLGYFSPERLEEIFLFAGAARALGENWSVRGHLGPGVQFIDGESKSAFRAEGALRGWFTPNLGLESTLGFSNAQEARNAYRYWWGGVNLIYAW